MSDRKIIAVVGATGAQGGGLVRAILDDPEGRFAARALTRDPSSEAARRLADAGAEVVAADVEDRESLRRAFEGAYGAFCVTFFWNHFSPEAELAHAANMADAARDETVTYNPVPPEVYRSFDFPGADDLGNMFQVKRDFEREFSGARDVERTRELNPRLQSYEEWLAANARRIPLGGG